MNNRLWQAFLAGCIGAIILVVIMYVLQAIGVGDPGFIGMHRGMFGENPPVDQILAPILFIISGGIWGLIFGLLIKEPTILKGMLFGLLPSFWLWIVVNAVLGKPLFNGFELKGLLMPFIYNVIIWGTVVGWYLSGKSSYRNVQHTV